MKRWDKRKNKEIENEKVDKFLGEITNICKKYKLSLAHESFKGNFIIEDYNEEISLWLICANIAEDCKTI